MSQPPKKLSDDGATSVTGDTDAADPNMIALFREQLIKVFDDYIEPRVAMGEIIDVEVHSFLAALTMTGLTLITETGGHCIDCAKSTMHDVIDQIKERSGAVH